MPINRQLTGMDFGVCVGVGFKGWGSRGGEGVKGLEEGDDDTGYKIK